MSIDTDNLSALSVDERLQLIETIWDSLSGQDNLPIPAWHLEEVERRRARLAANPGSALSWDEVSRQLRDKYGN